MGRRAGDGRLADSSALKTVNGLPATARSENEVSDGASAPRSAGSASFPVDDALVTEKLQVELERSCPQGVRVIAASNSDGFNNSIPSVGESSLNSKAKPFIPGSV